MQSCTRKVPLDCVQWDGGFDSGQEIIALMGEVGTNELPNPFLVGKHEMTATDWAVKEEGIVTAYGNVDFTTAFIVIP